MARNQYGTAVGQALTFSRGSNGSHSFEIHPPDGDDDILMKVELSGDNDKRYAFLRREQARRLARALLDAADA